VAPNEFLGGGAALFMIMPFLFIGIGLAYLSIAAGDKRGRQSHKVRVLPVGAQHPLSHVRSKMKPATETAPRRAEDKPATRRRTEPPWLTGV
jgi:hypothetical protein